MALRMRKDIKKSSYYVWFLGAQESKGLRGAEYIVPVVKSLVQRERDVEPFKVTLQVSHKGLKIIQNIVPPIANNPAGGKSGKNAKPEVVKHFIPHHAITCVLQDEDIVACILLLYNPVTKCPVHVHAYRCDSVETAEILRGQLQTLIERPDNQKKLSEIETRLRAKGLLLPPRGSNGSQPIPVVGNPVPRRVVNGGGSDGRSTSTRESESSGGSSSERLSGVGGHQERIASLYDSLAAELREKLGTGGSVTSDKPRHPQAPILLPPRDYDTVHRQKGNLTAIDLRRCLNENIVGVNVKNTRNLKETARTGGAGGTATAGGVGGRTPGSSGGSSGIGSDHAPSPDQQDRESDPRYLDNQSSSDEDWTEQPSEDSLFLVQPGRSVGGGSWRGPGTDLSLPRARRVHSNNTPSSNSVPPPNNNHHNNDNNTTASSPIGGDLAAFRRRRQAEERQRSPSPSHAHSNGPLSPRDRFKDAKEKFLLLEKERLEEQGKLERRRQLNNNIEPPISPAVVPPPVTNSNRGYRSGSWSRSRDSEDDLEDRHQNRYYSPPADDFDEEPVEDEDNEDVFEYPERLRARKNNLARRDSLGGGGVSVGSNGRRPPPIIDDHLNNPPEDLPPQRRHQVYRGTPRGERNLHHQYPPSPDRRPRYEEYGSSPDRRIASTPQSSSSRDRYLSPNPRPAPRGVPIEEVHARYPPPSRSAPQYSEEIPLERYRSPIRHPQPAPRHRVPMTNERDDSPDNHRQYPKRRSMFDALEDERRRNSNELAKEFKRRSYHDTVEQVGYHGYQELPERERYPGLDRESARAHHVPPNSQSQNRGGGGGSSGAGYRHSYAEGPIHHEMLHRTNSSVSSGRVGIAAIHPY
ncbi:serine/arginine repetitive matrix protein 2 [Anabrus simplex]|uniref:serine/arginine repetitive matrix protein 2 n=1 Tax=Anabrus simplex TaxID=316456 RepID=UPI0034DD501A